MNASATSLPHTSGPLREPKIEPRIQRKQKRRNAKVNANPLVVLWPLGELTDDVSMATTLALRVRSVGYRGMHARGSYFACQHTEGGPSESKLVAALAVLLRVTMSVYGFVMTL